MGAEPRQIKDVNTGQIHDYIECNLSRVTIYNLSLLDNWRNEGHEGTYRGTDRCYYILGDDGRLQRVNRSDYIVLIGKNAE